MSALLMLDTNAVTAIIKDRTKTLNALLNERPSCISVITEAELRFGLARRAVNTDLRRIVENYLSSVDILPWTSDSAGRYALLRAELDALGKPLAPMDLLIASHAMAEDCTLVSADRAFAQVPGLRVFDWTENSPVAATPAQEVRAKLAGAGITERDVADAVAQVRSAGRQATPKTKTVKKPKAK
jgi:tRNA(fMet)-specific endonuclease VapC